MLIMNRGVFRILSNTYNGVSCENSSRLKAVNLFRKKTQSSMFGRVVSAPLMYLSIWLLMEHYVMQLSCHTNLITRVVSVYI